MKLRSLLPCAAAVLLLAACQQPYSHVYYSTLRPSTLSRAPVGGGTPAVILAGNSTCGALAMDHRAQVLHCADDPLVSRRTLDGNLLGEFRVPRGVRALALDAKGGHIYLAEEKNSHDIIRTDRDGNNPAVIVKDATYCAALAFDEGSGTLYFSRMYPGSLWRCNADGSSPRQLATEPWAPTAIAVDRAHGRVYWAASDFSGGTAHIKRARLDGTESVTVLAKLPRYVEALEVDSAAGRIFWIERHGGPRAAYIRSAKLDGTDVRTVQEFAPGNHSTAMALGRLPRK